MNKKAMAFKIMFLDCVIGRRGILHTVSSLWPCQKHYLKHYGITVLLVLGVAANVGAECSMSMPTYRRLQAVEELMGESKLDLAEKKLNEMLAHLPKRKEDCAYIYYTTAMLNLQKSDYKKAKSYLKSAYQLKSFPEKTLLYMEQTLGGLCMQEEDFASAVGYYETYIKHAAEPNKDVYVGLGTAQYYRKAYPEAIQVLKQTIELFEPKPSPYLMLFSSYYELKHLGEATQTLERMVRLWPEEEKYWLQLATLYIEREAYEKSLEIMQAAWTRGYLTKETDILQYVYSLYEEHLPYKAAFVLNQAIKKRFVKENRKNYELLSTLFQEAKEREKAIGGLKKASIYSQDGKNDLCIAQLWFEMENAYDKVIEYASLAISKGIKKPGNAHMLIAVSYTELGKPEMAKKHLHQASQYKETKKASSRWLKSLRADSAESKSPDTVGSLTQIHAANLY